MLSLGWVTFYHRWGQGTKDVLGQEEGWWGQSAWAHPPLLPGLPVSRKFWPGLAGEGAWVWFSPALCLDPLSSRMGLWGLRGVGAWAASILAGCCQHKYGPRDFSRMMLRNQRSRRGVVPPSQIFMLLGPAASPGHPVWSSGEPG